MEKEQEIQDARVDLVPKSEHGDLPRETATGDVPTLQTAALVAFKHLKLYVAANFQMGTTKDVSPAVAHAYMVLRNAIEGPPPPVQLQDGKSPEWTCPLCGGDAMFCPCSLATERTTGDV